jgi:hypothetical protein
MKAKTKKVEPTAGDLIAKLESQVFSHPYARKCPRCSEDMGRVGLTSIVYTFEVCDCDLADYDHLIETLYHRDCFSESTRPKPEGVARD